MQACEHSKNRLKCEKCGANLELSDQEIKSRDELFSIMQKVLKDQANFDLTRDALDRYIEKNGATFAMSLIDRSAKEKLNNITAV